MTTTKLGDVTCEPCRAVYEATLRAMDYAATHAAAWRALVAAARGPRPRGGGGDLL